MSEYKNGDRVLVEGRVLKVDEGNYHKYQVSVDTAYVVWAPKVYPVTDELLQKLDEWADALEIHVGDVVRVEDIHAVVTRIDNAGYHLICDDGGSAIVDRTEIAKTGRHIDIEKLLAAIGESDGESDA